MPDQDEVVRGWLRKLELPPERSTFFEELRRRVAEHERRSARLWRRATVVLGAISIPAVAAAAVFAATLSAGSAVERTVSCQTQGGGVHFFAFSTNPTAKAAIALVATGATTSLFTVDTRYSGYTLSSSLCHPTKRRISLGRAGLAPGSTSSAGQYSAPTIYCPATPHVLLRFAVRLDGSGKPQSASLSIWSQPKAKRARSHPIAYAAWSPQRSSTYFSGGCTTSG